MLYKLMDKIDENNSYIDKEFIKKAYHFAYNAHKNQKRESGEPYIIHPIEVACILAEMGLDTSTVASGLLHDILEDTDYTYDTLVKEFTEEVATLVEGVTKLGKIKYKTKEEQQADNVRKMLLAMTKDIRVILIKLADRLHNMRTLKYMPINKQKEKAKETFDIYAPLAHRLGISKIKWELEDLAFRYLKPDDYYYIVQKISEKRIEREEYINKIITHLKKELDKASIKSEMDGRPKHFYSIYRKMYNKNKSIDQIFDLTAIRILVDTIKDCYAVLGIVHTLYKPVPGRFKDYIAMPKPNMYQSLHSTVIGLEGKPFEIQIRTYEMHKIAEYGIAAHWKYKEGTNGENDMDSKLSWVREMLEWQKETSDAEEFMEDFKIDLFSDEVFVFTPKGDVISLPYMSTPIDFAYKIHTDIGHRCIGGKVNGKIVPLDYRLRTGEIVEVLTSSVTKGPNMDWLNITKSNQAKSKIKAWFNKIQKEENIDKGRGILERESKKQGYNFGELAKGDPLIRLLKKYSLSSIDEIFSAIGVGSITPSTIINRLKEYNGIQNKEELTVEEINRKINKIEEKPKKKDKAPGIIVKGASNVLIRFAKCCNPVPGDEIIGYITQGRGISVHRKDCKNIKALINEDIHKVIEVFWGESSGNAYITEIQIKAVDRSGLLSEIMEIITEKKIHLYAINAKTEKNYIALINIKIRIEDIEQLKDLMKKLKRIKGINEIYRTKK